MVRLQKPVSGSVNANNVIVRDRHVQDSVCETERSEYPCRYMHYDHILGPQFLSHLCAQDLPDIGALCYAELV